MYDDDRDALAAEYVLGTLSADERDQAEALLLIDPGFAEIVRGWERRLGELNVMVEAVEPPPEIWDRIKTDIDGAERRIAAEAADAEAAEDKSHETEASVLPTIEEPAPQTVPESTTDVTADIAAGPSPELTSDVVAPPTDSLEAQPPQDEDDGAAVAALASSLLSPEPKADAEEASVPPAAAPAPNSERSADVIDLAGRVQRWRGFAVGMSAIAALLAVYIAISQFAPGLLPAGRGTQSAAVSTAAAPARLVAVLQQEPTAPAFLLTVDPQDRTMTVRRLTASPDPGRSYELWLISNNNPKPASLGLVGASEFTTRPLPQGFQVSALPTASYAISLEPAGGSPSGAPTGPILFKGKMVQAVPAEAAPKS
jgi:anti-sigma-K factor RskA